ncbi:hypothetical protein, partial [Enterobacter hormaechei]|uniref:hypothetical protein n=1 Tax=Enterobacter hormaechei TaxID=158836 RepID=UPI001952C386
LHKELLPLIVFMIRSIPALLCYGKRFMAQRIGTRDVFERQPAQAPTEFGLSEMRRLFLGLAELERSIGLG